MTNKIILEEGRRDMLLYARQKNVAADKLITKITEIDPSETKKYSMTILIWAVNEILKLKKQRIDKNDGVDPQDGWEFEEDSHLYKYAITNSFWGLPKLLLKFNKLNGNAFTKNFQEFKTSDDFRHFIHQYPDDYISKRQYKLVTKNPDNVKKVFENDKCLILNIKKYEAACIYGNNTKWCIAARDTRHHFVGYSYNYTIYFILNKTVSPTHELSKIAALVELENTDTDDGMDHLIVYDTKDTLIFSNMPEIDIPGGDDSDRNRGGYIEYYMDEYFISFGRYCKNTLGFDYTDVIVPRPTASD